MLLCGCGTPKGASPERDGGVSVVTQAVIKPPITAIDDTMIGAAAPFTNYATASPLSVSTAPPGATLQHSLVRFDSGAIAATLGGQSLYSARLELTVNGVSGGWFGGTLEVARMTENWIDLPTSGPTWVCRGDSNTTFWNNLTNECAPGAEWGMLPTDPFVVPFASSATARTSVFTTNANVVSFDVTADVQKFMTGTPNYGWIIKATGGPFSGAWVNFQSRETTAGPRLILDAGPDQCPSDPMKGAPGQCGCGTADLDANFDGVADCFDAATPVTADTTLRLAVPYGNDGTGPSLGVSSASIADLERALVRVDTPVINAARGGRHVDGAFLQVTVAGTSLGWGGGLIDIFPMALPWEEGNGLAGHGPSWVCRNDQDTTIIGLGIDNCAPGDHWGMFPGTPNLAFVPTPTDSRPLFWPGFQTVRFDVTADVQRFVEGQPNNGWMIQNRTGLLSGNLATFGSRETGAPPMLLLDLAPPCPPGNPCDAPSSCPLAAEERCASDATCACTGAPPSGTSPPCLQAIAQPGGTVRYVPLSAGSACTINSAQAGTCDALGYCQRVDAEPDDGNDCTTDASAGSGNFVHTAVSGTACASQLCGAAGVCDLGACACSGNSPEDNNDCTRDSCGPSGCTHTPVRDGHVCDDFVCTGTCNDGICGCPEVAPVPSGEPLRIGEQNAAALPASLVGRIAFGLIGQNIKTLGFAGCKTDWIGDADYDCLAGKLADKILASQYDVFVVTEAWDDDFKDAMVSKLHGSASDGKFPYIVRELDNFVISAQGVGQDSGLMLFSKWPFDRFVNGERGCNDAGLTQIDVIGAESHDVPFSNLAIPSYLGMDSAVGWHPFSSARGDDWFASKGVGYARVVSPTGKKYTVFFTHPQASYGSDDLDDWKASNQVRRDQLDDVRTLMNCASGAEPNGVTILTGDLNIEGDLTNPYSDESTPDLSAQLRQNDRWEWDTTFNAGPSPGGSGVLNGKLLDTWAYGMTRSECVPPIGGPLADVCRLNPAADAQGTKGVSRFDRGFTWNDFSTEERLDYVLLGSSTGARTEESWFGDVSPLHVTRGFNLLAGNDREAGITMFGSGGQEAPIIGGSSLLSDHIGINAEIDRVGQYSTVRTALVVPEISPGSSNDIDLQLPYRGAVQWIRIDQEGTFSFNVNPATQAPPVPSKDNGLTYRVYAATELSVPILSYKGELRYIPPQEVCGSGEFAECRTIPGFAEEYFPPVASPLYVKVFHASKDYPSNYTGQYKFVYRMSGCATLGESCLLVPDRPIKDFRLLAGAPDAFFSFHVDQPDYPPPQHLALSALEHPQQPGQISKIEVLNEDGSPLLLGSGQTPVLLTRQAPSGGNAEWRFDDTTGQLEALVDRAAGRTFMLHVRRSAAVSQEVTLDLQYTTNLTWVYGPRLDGTNGDIHCNNSQEVGADEIWMKILADDAPPPSDQATDGIELNGDFNEDESTEDWTEKILPTYATRVSTGTSAPPLPAIRFTQHLDLRLYEDDGSGDETANQSYTPLLESTPDARDLPASNWDFPKEFLVNTGNNYDGHGPSMSHYMPAKACRTDADCDGKCRLGVCRRR